MKYKCYLTKGMDGKIVATIADSKSPERRSATVLKWKNNKVTRSKYRVQPYCRRIGKGDRIVEDFGDYSYFLLYVTEAE